MKKLTLEEIKNISEKDALERSKKMNKPKIITVKVAIDTDMSGMIRHIAEPKLNFLMGEIIEDAEEVK